MDFLSSRLNFLNYAIIILIIVYCSSLLVIAPVFCYAKIVFFRAPRNTKRCLLGKAWLRLLQKQSTSREFPISARTRTRVYVNVPPTKTHTAVQ